MSKEKRYFWALSQQSYSLTIKHTAFCIFALVINILAVIFIDDTAAIICALTSMAVVFYIAKSILFMQQFIADIGLKSGSMEPLTTKPLQSSDD